LATNTKPERLRHTDQSDHGFTFCVKGEVEVALRESQSENLSAQDLLWALGSLCRLYRRPFSAELLQQQFPPPYDRTTLLSAAKALEFKIAEKTVDAHELATLPLPCLAFINLVPVSTEAPLGAVQVQRRSDTRVSAAVSALHRNQSRQGRYGKRPGAISLVELPIQRIRPDRSTVDAAFGLSGIRARGLLPVGGVPGVVP
jgi:hypothetical protein